MNPVPPAERYAHIDLLRGLALFGVLVVNMLSGFSLSLFDYISRPGAKGIIDTVVANFLEFRAFALFSFLFGIGAAIQSTRAPNPHSFLARRFAVLLAIGLAHIVFIWNGDILALYGVCGLLLIPFIKAPTPVLLAFGVAAILQQYIIPLPIPWPSTEAMRAHGAEATRIYSQGSFAQILAFRCDEALRWIMPLWISVIPRTFGLMLLGMAAWRHEALRHPRAHRRTLTIVFAVSVAAAVLDLMLDLDAPIPLAAVYASAILLWLDAARLAPIAALGRMALTNYLLQSVTLTLVFYGYGLGLFGKLDSAAATALAAALYIAQAFWSHVWLRTHNFGPAEWLWRSAAYGKIPRLRS